MSNHATRLRNLEHAMRPAADKKPWAWGTMDYGDDGQTMTLELAPGYEASPQARTFKPLPGETELELCDRAMAEVAPGDNLVLWRCVRPGPNGGLAPGYERFAR